MLLKWHYCKKSIIFRSNLIIFYLVQGIYVYATHLVSLFQEKPFQTKNQYDNFINLHIGDKIIYEDYIDFLTKLKNSYAIRLNTKKQGLANVG